MWRAKPPSTDEVIRFRAARERYDLSPLVIHVNYLINLATLDPTLREKSITALRGEIERAVIIGADFLVTHPGNYRSLSIEEGMAAVALSIAEATKDLSIGGLTVLLENTVGAGAQLGGKLEELRMIRDLTARVTDIPVGYCLDTCHLLASGYDVATRAGLEKTVASAASVLGMDEVRVFHANDSKGALGSHIDRHANIGQGHIGLDGFSGILRHPALRSKPFILETPVDEEGDDRRNIDTLKRLSKNARKGVRL